MKTKYKVILSIIAAVLVMAVIALSIVLVLTATSDNANTSIKIKYEAKQVNAHIEMEVWHYNSEAGQNILVPASNNEATFDDASGSADGTANVDTVVDSVQLGYGDYVTYTFKVTNKSSKDSIHFNLYYEPTLSDAFDYNNELVTLKYGVTNTLWSYTEGYSLVTYSPLGIDNPNYGQYNNNDVLIAGINGITASDSSALNSGSASIFGTIITGNKYQSSSYVEIKPNTCYKVEIKFAVIDYNSITGIVNFDGSIYAGLYNSKLGCQQWSAETSI